jgi:hypothetical protein
MVVVEVHLTPGATQLQFSDEILRDTQAQVMTPEEAGAVGFQGLPVPPAGVEVRYVAVAQRDARWIMNALEAISYVSSFRVHDVG